MFGYRKPHKKRRTSINKRKEISAQNGQNGGRPANKSADTLRRTETIWHFICDYAERECLVPTFETIMEGCGISSKSVVDYHVKKLVNMGKLERVGSRLRIAGSVLKVVLSSHPPMKVKKNPPDQLREDLREAEAIEFNAKLCMINIVSKQGDVILWDWRECERFHRGKITHEWNDTRFTYEVGRWFAYEVSGWADEGE